LFRDLVFPEIRLLPPRRIGLGYSLLHAAEDLIAAGLRGRVSQADIVSLARGTP
jgi:hypothetical protein